MRAMLKRRWSFELSTWLVTVLMEEEDFDESSEGHGNVKIHQAIFAGFKQARIEREYC